jgi:hypothetical protein
MAKRKGQTLLQQLAKLMGLHEVTDVFLGEGIYGRTLNPDYDPDSDYDYEDEFLDENFDLEVRLEASNGCCGVGEMSSLDALGSFFREHGEEASAKLMEILLEQKYFGSFGTVFATCIPSQKGVAEFLTAAGFTALPPAKNPGTGNTLLTFYRVLVKPASRKPRR